MNVGIVGAGNISDTHARAAHAAGLRVVAVFGDNRHKTAELARRFGATAFDTLDALLQHPSLDTVVIGSPSGCHAQQAAAAARSGRHVLVEKPLDISTARVDALLEEVGRAGVTLGIFFQDRLKPDVVSMKRQIDAGEIGTPVLATGEVKWWRPPDYYASSRWRGTWALDGGGALMNQGIHTLDVMLHLLGPVRRVSGLIATRFHAIETEDTAIATLEFASGALATIEATTAACPGRLRRLEIVGSAGTLLLEGDRLASVASASEAALAVSRNAAENTTSPIVSDVSAHQRIIEDFVDAIRTGRPPVCDGREARRSVEVVEAVYRSARDKTAIHLPAS
ncbi:MAG TPA: Gfo/Idh/MocA family oxidoreductase [Bradyrhizobium sp.]|nr:Gfo/Idh/MocA family oxidoreductase [Bradyrhizobium sp.]